MLTATKAKGQARIFDFANEETEASGVVDLIDRARKQVSIIMKSVLARTNQLPAAVAANCTSQYSLFYKRWIRFIFGQILKQLISAIAIAGQNLDRRYAIKISNQLESFASNLALIHGQSKLLRYLPF